MQCSIRTLITLLLPIAAFAVSCDDDGPTPAERFCDAAAGVPADGCEGGCQDALLADCAKLAGVLNDGYLDRSADCMEAGGELVGCMRESTAALTPTQAHRDLAASFCSSCALGVSGCEDVFFSGGDDDSARLGAAIVPLSDGLANQIASECASGLTCAATFASCSQAQIAAAGLPTNAIGCLVNEVFLGGDATCE
jgi:hypothetical protein